MRSDHSGVTTAVLQILAIVTIILLGTAVQRGVDLPAPLRWGGVLLVVGLIALGVAREPNTARTLRGVNWPRVAVVSGVVAAIAAALLAWKS
ncbi:MAG TPA: hypothetical protein VNL70_08485 [Tepidisphaeraceae bacterium]|nr:hypothetical protein [Tepidisphaeraceae bacterium]